MTIEATTDPLPVDQAFARPADHEAISRAAKGLSERNYTTHVVDTVADARALVRDLLPRDKAIFTANSESVRLSGLGADIDEGGEFVSVRARLAGVDPADIRAQITIGATPEVILGSVHAVTEDGLLVVTSFTGSQLGPYAAGAEQVVYVVGAQKVVPDLDTALRRVRAHSLPLVRNVMRERGMDSAVGKTLILEREFLSDRATVVLTREAIGF
ncbi:LUD domain-containing protein [Actinophytocola glycyrrhizae]|uniref:LUD domain-containing protein n=1 Tax=Actinophytocola glycyrrhizae TaxID=2044873 RepID=A0ABV9RZY8_9PSEU